jgi:signal peptidase II
MKPPLIRRGLLLFAVAAATAVLDQGTKWLVRQHFTLYESKNIIGEYFRLTFIYNYGAAFGTNPQSLVRGIIDPTLFFCLLSLLAGAAVAYLFFKTKPEEAGMRFSLALITGGAIGNFIDRVRFGKVVDFLDAGVNGRLRWPVFNAADSAVTVGITLIIFLTLFSKKTKNQETRKPETPGAGS